MDWKFSTIFKMYALSKNVELLLDSTLNGGVHMCAHMHTFKSIYVMFWAPSGLLNLDMLVCSAV